jgi:prephenate dehydrogenase
MKITIIGDGVFGRFLKEELAAHAEITADADTVMIAVPVSAYDAVASAHAGKHLVNVCSVQHKPNQDCLKHSARVTGIHPMFGPQSPLTNRTCIVTQACDDSKAVFDLFEKIGAEIVTHKGDRTIDGALHDDMMRKTHLPVLMFGELAALIVEQAADVPDNCLPTSFKRLKALAEQMKDMSPGTVESIRSNLQK